MAGPLEGFTILELAGIGPGPFCGMMLADMGATVVRIDRPGGNPGAMVGHSVLNRTRQSVAVNLKDPAGVEVVLKLCETADGIFEGNRPGVTERLGVGPEDCLARNPKLVYGRMTGWGQDGPMAHVAGHDINYIALAGALHAIGNPGGPPVPPINLVGDFGGGGMLLAYGMVCGLLHAQKTGQGDVIDAAMIDGTAALMGMVFGSMTQGFWTDERGANALDTGAHYYDTYETADGKWISLGSIEPQFYALMLDKLGLTEDADFTNVLDKSMWPTLKKKIADVVATKTRDEWDDIMLGTDVCYAPVLSLAEAPHHEHNVARGTFIELDGGPQHAPAPRFERAGTPDPFPQKPVGVDTVEVLASAGFASDEIDALIESGAIATG
ncbi:MAG: CaiB/BaiF CoA-transferase family protein [Nitriliruptorales bacterium]|nr:CaiB/BaiF CoA-transferase family protein [Nitriliruptorales bacterium]